MRRMKCKCGSEKFNADKYSTKLRCAVCFQKYLWKNGWTELSLYAETKKNIAQIFVSTASKPFELVDYILHHPKREKKQAEKPVVETKEFPVFRTKSVDIEKRIRARWVVEIKCLEQGHELVFTKHNHKGKLRGVHIARACHHDLARIGIKTSLKLKDQTGFVEAAAWL